MAMYADRKTGQSDMRTDLRLGGRQLAGSTRRQRSGQEVCFPGSTSSTCYCGLMCRQTCVVIQFRF